MVRKARLMVRRQEVDQVMNDQQHLLRRGLFRSPRQVITEDWKLWMIDFSRAFRRWRDLLEPGHLAMCDRQLLANLRQLKEADVLVNTKPHLTKDEVKALMARRDKIVTFFDKQIAQKGESAVLY
jgi:hypothetical protein